MPRPLNLKAARLELTLDPALKARLARAAASRRMTLSAFVLAAAAVEAAEVERADRECARKLAELEALEAAVRDRAKANHPLRNLKVPPVLIPPGWAGHAAQFIAPALPPAPPAAKRPSRKTRAPRARKRAS